MTTKTNPRNQLAYSIAEICETGPFGRSKVYEEINAGRLKAKKMGRKTIILDADQRAWLNSLPEFPLPK